MERGECAHCESVLYGEKDVKTVPVNPGEDVIASALTGLTPRHIVTAAFHGVQFWCDQLELAAHSQLRLVSDTAARHEEAYKAKLREVHDAYKKAKQKQQELWVRHPAPFSPSFPPSSSFLNTAVRSPDPQDQMQSLERDKKELQSKYEQKSGEKRRIESQLQQLQLRLHGAGAGAPGGGVTTQQYRAFHQTDRGGGDVTRHSLEHVKTVHTFDDRALRASGGFSRRHSGGVRAEFPSESPGRSRGGHDPRAGAGAFGGAARPLQLGGGGGSGGVSRPSSPLARDRPHFSPRRGAGAGGQAIVGGRFRGPSPSRSVFSAG